MLDPQLLRNDPDAVAAALKPRGYALDVDKWRELEAQRKDLQMRTQELQNICLWCDEFFAKHYDIKNLSAKPCKNAHQESIRGS